MSRDSTITLPTGDRMITIAEADRELRLLRLGIATTISLMPVVGIGALVGETGGTLGLAMALFGAGVAGLIDLRAGRKVYVLTDRHVLIRIASGSDDIPYAEISGVQRWFGTLNLKVGTRIVSLEDLRDVRAWEATVRKRVRSCRT